MSELIDPTQAFEYQRAELEVRWLERVFWAPREFGLMTGPHSILVMGEAGSGKSALEIQLKTFAAQKVKPGLLVAAWRPELSDESPVADVFMHQAMNALSFSFLQSVVRMPEIYTSAPSYAQKFMPWFVQRYLQEDREFNLSRLEEGAVAGGLEAAANILSVAPYSFSYATPTTILPPLTQAIKALGFDGIWIFLDGLDNLFRRQPEQVEKFFVDFLSSLDYFEDPVFSFKIIVTRELGLRLQETRGVLTRRFKIHHLKWREEELAGMIEKRAAISLGRDTLPLGELCATPDWLRWIKCYAGNSPRGWLKITSPILAAYLEKGQSLTGDEWLDVYRQSPPLLHVDVEAGRVFIGSGEITVSAVGYKLLKYLYLNRDRSCSKSELYFCAHKELPKEPHVNQDEGWEDLPFWEGTLDTALWRLRQTIEWDMRRGATPVYIVSERGRGHIRLENAE